jgi:hypothetical protein
MLFGDFSAFMVEFRSLTDTGTSLHVSQVSGLFRLIPVHTVHTGTGLLV